MTVTRMRPAFTKCILALAILIAALQGCSDSTPTGCSRESVDLCEAALVAVLVEPRQFAGRTLLVTGYLASQQGVMRLYLSEDSHLAGDAPSSIRVIVDGPEDDDLTEFLNAYVNVVGVIELRESGEERIGVRIQQVNLIMRPESRSKARQVVTDE